MPCTSVSLLGQLRQANLSLEPLVQLKYYGSRRSTSEGQPASPTDFPGIARQIWCAQEVVRERVKRGTVVRILQPCT